MISDAGTPGICDPGAQLAAALVEARIPLHPVPGASAVTAALSVCGMPGSQFTFLGFLPPRGADKQQTLEVIRNTAHLCVFFEAPHRVLDTFRALVVSGQGERSCLCARELTKRHEELWRGSVSAALVWLEGRAGDERLGVRGEFTVVLGPHRRVDAVGGGVKGAQEQLQRLRGDGLARSEAVRLVTEMSAGELSKAAVYKLALDMDWGAEKR